MAKRSEFACHGLATLVVCGRENMTDRRGPAGSLLCAGWVSASAFPLFPVVGLNPVSASCGTNGFLPTGSVHLNPASRGSPRPLGASIQASVTTATTAGTPARAAWGPRGLIISLHGRGHPPGIHSHVACPSLSWTREPSREIREVWENVPFVANSGF